MTYTMRILIGALIAWINDTFRGMSYRNYHQR
jgi:hypothetical protein